MAVTRKVRLLHEHLDTLNVHSHFRISPLAQKLASGAVFDGVHNIVHLSSRLNLWRFRLGRSYCPQIGLDFALLASYP
jgi:hypothetical protein